MTVDGNTLYNNEYNNNINKDFFPSSYRYVFPNYEQPGKFLFLKQKLENPIFELNFFFRE